MTPRERILSVFRGERPDTAPCMLDLSHWFYHRTRRPWDLSVAYAEPERALIDYHRQVGAGFYIPNLASFFSTEFPAGVRVSTRKRRRKGAPEIVWRMETPSGAIERARVWDETTYAWAISEWGVRDEAGLRVFQEALSGRRFRSDWQAYRRWDEYVGDCGVVYLPVGYSATGRLLNYWMGIEGVVYATVDFPDALRQAVDAVNRNTLDLVDLVCESPAEIVVMGDNFSSDIQPRAFFDRWSRPFYEDAIERLHRAGKRVAVHIDGKLRGALRLFRELGADCADAVTPTPMGDLTAAECRAEAGDAFILSGGVSPDLWMPGVPVERFDAKLREWLAQKETTTRFICNAGDQVPPGAEESRIRRMVEIVEAEGRLGGD